MRQICVNRYRYASCIAGLVLLTTAAFAQKDLGPRGDPAAAGEPFSAVKSDSNLMAVFQTGFAQFTQVEEVVNDGLGPRFNSNSCSSCHAQPAVGGTSPGVGGITTPALNPQVQFANANNPLPPFITANGPVREVRFIRKPDGTPDGGVHNLFTIMGQPGAPPGCVLAPENFSNTSNIIFRIPTPLYGLGLIEAIPDHTLVQNVANSASKSLGIQGALNRQRQRRHCDALRVESPEQVSCCSPGRLTTWRWESPTSSSTPSGTKRRIVHQRRRQTTCSTSEDSPIPRCSTTSTTSLISCGFWPHRRAVPSTAP